MFFKLDLLYDAQNTQNSNNNYDSAQYGIYDEHEKCNKAINDTENAAENTPNDESFNIEEAKEFFTKIQEENKSLKIANNDLVNKCSELRNELEAKNNILSTLQTNLIATKNEMEKMHERHQKTLNDEKEYAITKFAKDILNVVDSFEKAIENMNITDINGVNAIMKEMLGVLKSHRISQVESDNVEFDPAFHMAVSNVSYEDIKNDSIKDEIQENFVYQTMRRGYKIGDRCLREALVIVYTGK